MKMKYRILARTNDNEATHEIARVSSAGNAYFIALRLRSQYPWVQLQEYHRRAWRHMKTWDARNKEMP